VKTIVTSGGDGVFKDAFPIAFQPHVPPQLVVSESPSRVLTSAIAQKSPEDIWLST
jgi:hypothetical protein